MFNKLSITISLLFFCLGTTVVYGQFSINKDSLGLRLLVEDVYDTDQNESHLADQILYLIGSGSNKSLSPIVADGGQDFLFKGDSMVWNNYTLKGDIIGTNYGLYIWALGFGTTLKADIFVNTTIVATVSFYANETYITSGTLYNFIGIDPNTQTGDKVSLKIKNIGNDAAALAWGSGTTSYIKIPGIITNVTDKETTFLPEKALLSQNYPNPFNPLTKISYQIPTPGFVKINIYDLLGREVSTLVNEYKNAGKYGIEFNASNMPSGIFFYKMQSGSFSETKKLILIK